MLSLYLAVKLLQRRGRRVRLVRLGETELGGVDPRSLGALREGVIELGSVGWREIPGYLALADAFVQPGEADDFNRYRLPSKLPEFLAMGRPVVLPDCNIGHDLADGRNALLLQQGDGLEIAARVERLIDDRELRARLASGARSFALEQLNWQDNSIALGRFLNRISRAHPAGDAAVEVAAASAS
jgi:glycosyltransferase involved in cell wall biosynthesis